MTRMSVAFEFLSDPAEIARVIFDGAEGIAVDHLVYHYFVMPVRLRIGGSELLSETSQIVSPWSRLALINTCVVFKDALANLDAFGRAAFDPGERGGDALILVLDGDAVNASDIDGSTGTASLDALRLAILRFDRTAREYILREVPQLERHPEVGSWLIGMQREPWPE